MIAIFSLLILLALFVPAGLGLLVLFVALDVFLKAHAISLNLGQSLILAGLLLSIPISAFVSGALLDRFSSNRERTGRVFAVLLPILCGSLMLASGAWLDYFEAALNLALKAGSTQYVLMLTAISSAIVFCAGLAAAILMLAELTFEIPLRWFQGALAARIDLTVAAIRPLALVLGISLAMNLLIGLFAHELWPASILRHF